MSKIPGILVSWLLLFIAGITLASDSVTMIIFPLENQSQAASLAWLGDGEAVAIAKQLQMPGIKVLDYDERVRLVESIDLPPSAPLSRASMIRVAQHAQADIVVMGAFKGTVQSLRISVKVLDIRTMKLSGDIVANGSFTVLPQMENELGWLILTNSGLNKVSSRDKFKERIRNVPNTAYAYFVRSLSAVDENEGIKLLLKAVQLYGDFPEAHFRLGRYYFQKGACRNAVPHLTIGRKEEGTYPQNEFMLGTCYLEQNSLAEAIQALSQALSRSRPVEALNNLGVAYLRKGDYSVALQNLQEARTLAKTDPTVALNLAIFWYLQGNDSAARAVLEESVKTHPKDGMLQFLLGMVLRVQGENEKAALALSQSRSHGINTEKLETDDPKNWTHLLSTWHP